MTSNSTDHILLYNRADMMIVYGLFIISVCTAISLSIFITILVGSIRSLRNIPNLLVTNTCMATICTMIIVTSNMSMYVFEISLTDQYCRLLGYLNYSCLTMVAYSYLIQSLSRLFFTNFSNYRWLLTGKAHLVLIIVQNTISYLFPLPSLLTNDIVYRPLAMCLIPMAYLKHIVYFFATTYISPLLVVILIHLKIHHQVRQSSKRMANRDRQINKRDLRLTKIVLLLFVIFLLAGFPGIIYVMIIKLTYWDSEAMYEFTIASVAIAMSIEKISLLFLNMEIRNTIRRRFRKLFSMRVSQIEPFTLQQMTMTIQHRGVSILTPVH